MSYSWHNIDDNNVITLSFTSSRFLVYITLETNYQLDLTTGDFSDLIAFNKAIITSSRYEDKLPDITRPVDDVIHTNVISDSIVSGISSDVLYRFRIENLPLSYPFHKEGRRLLYNKINTNMIKELRIYFTDSLN